MLDAQRQSAHSPGGRSAALATLPVRGEVIALMGFGSRSAFRKEVARGALPKYPFALAKAKLLVLSEEIAQWQSARMAARDMR